MPEKGTFRFFRPTTARRARKGVLRRAAGKAECPLFLCVLVAGCVERVERIQVHDDAAVTMRLRFEADQADELEAGRVPTRDMGWTIRRSTRRGENDEEAKHVLEADRSFDAGDDLPATYASSTDPHAERHLQFPTEVTMEPRIDGLYFHFRRVYPARPHAVIDGIRKELLARHDLASTDDIDIDEMSDAELAALIRTLTRFEAEKCLAFARAAYLELTPFRGQDGWLALRKNVLAVYEQIGDEHYRDFARMLRRAAARTAPVREAHDRGRDAGRDRRRQHGRGAGCDRAVDLQRTGLVGSRSRADGHESRRALIAHRPGR
jgi:hypothetical protein